MKSIFIRGITMILLFFIPAWFFTQLLVPKYVYESIEGRLIEGYYDEVKAHDVLFIGDCEVYESFSPVTLWEEFGITSYIRGSAQQLIWQSYYLLEETLKYEKPKVVVFNVLAMQYDTPQREAYNRLTLDGMKWSMAKLKAINASVLPEEHLLTYLFPLLRYHSRWQDLKEEDFDYLFKKPSYFHNGYYMNVGIQSVGELPVVKPLVEEQFGDNAYAYLNKMVELCKKNGIELVLVKVPTVYPHWYDSWEQQMIAYAQANEIVYINYLSHDNKSVIDFKTDTYDAGLHLNVYGAEKLSLHFGTYLKNRYDLADHRQKQSAAESWAEKVKRYHMMKQLLEDEYKQYGEIRMYQRPVED